MKRMDAWFEPSFEYRRDEDPPEGWTFVALGNVGVWGSGGTPSKAQKKFWGKGDKNDIPWVSPKDMKVPFIGDAQDHLTPYAITSGAATTTPSGTILFVVRGMILAHSFPVALTVRDVAFNQDMRSILPHPAVDGRYLLRVLQHESLEILFAVQEATHGTLRLESSTLHQWPVPLPPLAEQLRIVRRLDEILGSLDRACDALTHLVRLVGTSDASAIDGKRVRNVLLSKAFRGELVPTEAELARAEGRSFESAEEMLKRVKGGGGIAASSPAKRPRRRRKE